MDAYSLNTNKYTYRYIGEGITITQFARQKHGFLASSLSLRKHLLDSRKAWSVIAKTHACEPAFLPHLWNPERKKMRKLEVLRCKGNGIIGKLCIQSRNSSVSFFTLSASETRQLKMRLFLKGDGSPTVKLIKLRKMIHILTGLSQDVRYTRDQVYLRLASQPGRDGSGCKCYSRCLVARRPLRSCDITSIQHIFILIYRIVLSQTGSGSILVSC